MPGATHQPPPEGEPSPEELVALLEALGQQYQGKDVPEDLLDLLDNVKRSKGDAAEHDVEEVVPQPGFVVKTTDQDGRKVFVNICSSPTVPAPGGWASAAAMPQEVLDALEAANADPETAAGAEALRFPLSCGELRPDTDKRGEPCAVVDCILAPEVVAGAAAHRPLKAFLIELALGWACSKHGLQLDPRFKLPKMAYKGAGPAAQRIKRARRALVTEVDGGGGGGAPSFPLRLAPGAGQAGAGPGGAAAGKAAAGGAQQAERRPRDQGPGPRAALAMQQQQQQLRHSLTYDGCPATAALLTVELPVASSSGQPLERDGVVVEVAGQEAWVSAAGAPPLRVQLPFAVDAAAARATLAPAQSALRVRLPYLPVAQYVAQLRDAAPHAFGSLPISHADLMELE